MAIHTYVHGGHESLQQGSRLQRVYHSVEDVYISETTVKSNIVGRIGLEIRSYKHEESLLPFIIDITYPRLSFFTCKMEMMILT